MQWDSNTLWESRYIWLPMEIDEAKRTLDLVWHDIYDLNVYVSFSLCLVLANIRYFRKTGEWKPVQGTEYFANKAITSGNAFKQEAVSYFGSTISS